MKKQLLFTMFIMFILLANINLVSSADWDNIKSYDEESKVIEIRNSILGIPFLQLSKVAEIQLNTPQVYNVIRGEDRKVAEFTITNHGDYNNALKSMDFYNNYDGEKFDRDFVYKQKVVVGTKEVDVYETQCFISKVLENKTEIEECNNIKVGTQIENIIEWKILDLNQPLPEGELTVGIFTDVLPNDNVEWIPTFFGVEIDEWATWTDNFNTNLRAYYKFEESEGDLLDSENDYDLTNNGLDYEATGRIDYGVGAIYANTDSANITSLLGITDYPYTINTWFKSNYQTTEQNVIGFGGVTVGSYRMIIGFNTDGYIKLWEVTSDGDDYPVGSVDLIDNSWHMITLICNSSTKRAVYVDGSSTPSITSTEIKNFGSNFDTFLISSNQGGSANAEGTIDEIGVWSRSLSTSEMSDLWNEGNGLEYPVNKNPSITLINPTNYYNTTETNVTFNATITDDVEVSEVKLFINEVLNDTNTSLHNGTYIWEMVLAEGDYNWSVRAEDNESAITNSSTYDFLIDYTDPTIDVSSPTGIYEYLYEDYNLTLNITINDTNLDACWYEYNDANNTFDCTTEVLSTNYFNYSLGVNSLIVYSNDSVGNENSSTISWEYQILENNRTFTSTAFETANETYSINISANSSLTGIKLFWNDTNYTLSNQGDGLWSYARDMPIGVGEYNFSYKFTYAGDIITSSNSTQEVNFTFFTPTNGTYTDIFLNISFEDENSLVEINASVPSAEFVYYLGTGTVNKTLDFINNTDNDYFTFSGTTGSENLKVIPTVQYRRVSDYPQRIWEASTQVYNSTDTNEILYLLSSVDGIFVTYQVLTTTETAIQDVEVVSTRVVSGESIQVGAGTTDSAGLITFWMNPDFQHTTTFTKNGYDEYVFTHFPTQASYTITLGGDVEPEADCIQGISQSIRPTSGFLYRNETYDFNYTINSAYWNLTNFQFTLTYANGSSIGSNSSSSSSGGTISLNNINVSNSASINMVYLYEIDSDDCEQITGTSVWITQTTEGTEFSIWQLSQDINTNITSGLFGFDNFGKTLLSFLIIVLMVGGLSMRYGIASEGAIMGILFGTVFILDVGLNLIPRVQIGDIVSINHFFTVITFLILFVIIIREERH